MITTVGNLNIKFDELMMPFGSFDKRFAKGFVIGKGKILFWYIVPQKTGFTAYPLEINSHWTRSLKPETEITIKYNF